MTNKFTYSRTLKTRFQGRYLNNDDLQRYLLVDSIHAKEDGERVLSDYLYMLAERLNKLKD